MDFWTPTDGAGLLAAAVLLPFVGMLLVLAFGGRWPQRVAFIVMPLGLALALGIAVQWQAADGALVYLLGGWSPPLGIALRADGAAVAMLLAVAVVVCGIGLYARADFSTPTGMKESRAAYSYWLLLLAVWGALNLVFVSGDLFTLYVALELLTFAGVPLVCLAGSAFQAKESVPNHSQLSTQGFNALVRHPLYLGLLLLLLGWFLISPGLLVLVLLGSVLVYLPFGIYFEELKLKRQFGQAYLDYTKRVKCLIPGLW